MSSATASGAASGSKIEVLCIREPWADIPIPPTPDGIEAVDLEEDEQPIGCPSGTEALDDPICDIEKLKGTPATAEVLTAQAISGESEVLLRNYADGQTFEEYLDLEVQWWTEEPDYVDWVPAGQCEEALRADTAKKSAGRTRLHAADQGRLQRQLAGLRRKTNEQAGRLVARRTFQVRKITKPS